MASSFEIRNEPNYAAQVVEVKHLVPLSGLDNLVGLPWSGYMALVPKTTQIGDVLVVFPAETQLSEAFASERNLFRHAERNRDNVPGYLDDNRRVKAIRLRGNISSALALELPAAWDIPVGASFDTVDGEEICRKYEIAVKRTGLKAAPQPKWRRVDEKFLPQHPDTAQYLREADNIPDDTWFVVSQKAHGSSVRISHTVVKRRMTWKDRVAKWFGVAVKDHDYDHVYGSRRVIKDPNSETQAQFYDYDIWTEAGRQLDDLIPPGVLLYGELIGWTKDGAPIQKDYTYDLPVRQSRLLVYRVAVVTDSGFVADLSWDGMMQFCAERGVDTVRELWRGRKADFVPEMWLDRRFHDEGYANAVRLSHPSLPDEGVVVRAEGIIPRAWKIKGPRFYEHESVELNSGEVDLESAGSVE